MSYVTYLADLFIAVSSALTLKNGVYLNITMRKYYCFNTMCKFILMTNNTALHYVRANNKYTPYV